MPARRQTANFRGLALCEEIRRKMDETGVGALEFARLIGLSPSHTNSLMSGGRPWDGTDRVTKEKIAKFLGLPLINVLMLAGIVEPRDFMSDDTLDTSLDNAYSAIKSHPVWGAFCTTKGDWHALPTNARILMALLYEKAMEIEVLQKAQLIKVVERKSRHPGPSRKAAA